MAQALPDKQALQEEIRKQAESWAKTFDGNSLVVQRRAAIRFDVEKDLPRIKAKVLYVLSRTDRVFPSSIAPPVLAKMEAAKIDLK